MTGRQCCRKVQTVYIKVVSGPLRQFCCLLGVPRAPLSDTLSGHQGQEGQVFLFSLSQYLPGLFDTRLTHLPLIIMSTSCKSASTQYLCTPEINSVSQHNLPQRYWIPISFLDWCSGCPATAPNSHSSFLLACPWSHSPLPGHPDHTYLVLESFLAVRSNSIALIIRGIPGI